MQQGRNKNDEYCIYKLVHPTRGIFYIGLTKDAKTRSAAHKSKYGNLVSFVIIHRCAYGGVFKMEREYIEKYKSRGHRLINKTERIKTSAPIRVSVKIHLMARNAAASRQISIRDYISLLVKQDLKKKK